MADVAFELRPDGRLAYTRVVVTCPRQQGKSVLVLASLLLRSLGSRGQMSVYAAQTGKEARSKLKDDWRPFLDPFGAQISLEAGAEAVRFANGSMIRLHSGSETGLHGVSADAACLDEAWAYQDNRHEAAILPAMMARPNPQLWIASTQGIAGRSLYLQEQCQRGRAAVEADVREGVAFFEWSADPASDPVDPRTWAECMPALGRTVSEDFVRDAQRSMPPHEFARGFLNLQSSGVSDAVIPLGDWQALAAPDAPRPDWVALGVDVAPKGRSAAIAAAGVRDGLMYGTVLEHGAGTEWLPAAIQRRAAEYGSPYVCVDGKAVADLLPEIRQAANFKTLELTAAEVSAGCGFWLRLVREGRFRHRGERELVVALDGAGQRTLGDGFAWSRSRSGTDITPLCALTWATEFHRGSWNTLEQVTK